VRFSAATPNSSLHMVLGADRAPLKEDSFHAVISLERKRTERSKRPFLLMLLDVENITAHDKHGKKVSKILSAISSSTRGTDISGWYKNNAVIGILFTEIGDDPRKGTVGAMLARVKGILYSTLSFEEFNHITISHYIFPEKWDHDVQQRPSHPTLYPDVSQRENMRKGFSIIKRIIDVVGSVVGLILCAPLFGLIAAAIRLTSKGPVFFRQQRVGQIAELAQCHGFVELENVFAAGRRNLHLETTLRSLRPERFLGSRAQFIAADKYNRISRCPCA